MESIQENFYSKYVLQIRMEMILEASTEIDTKFIWLRIKYITMSKKSGKS